MSVFVTGGSGLLGQEIVRRLVADGREVTALARSVGAARTLLDLGVTRVVDGDVLDRDALRQGLDGAEVAYHVAGVNAFCLADPAPMYRANIEGARRVAEAGADVGLPRLVMTSSASALGEVRGTVGTETSLHRGRYLSSYERSKHLGEEAVRAVAERTGLDVVYVLPSSVQGPGRASGTGKLLLDILNGALPAIVESRLSIVDIADCTEGHVRAEHHGEAGRRYLLNGATMTVAEGVALLERLTGAEISVRTLPGALAAAGGTAYEGLQRLQGKHPRFCREMVRTLLHGHAYDGSRAERELGLRYTPVEETVTRTLRWFAEQGMLTRDLPRLTA